MHAQVVVLHECVAHALSAGQTQRQGKMAASRSVPTLSSLLDPLAQLALVKSATAASTNHFAQSRADPDVRRAVFVFATQNLPVRPAARKPIQGETERAAVGRSCSFCMLVRSNAVPATAPTPNAANPTIETVSARRA